MLKKVGNMEEKDYKKEFYEYGESLGIKINDLQRLMVLAKSADVELSPDVPNCLITKEELKDRFKDFLTIGKLKKILSESELPDDGKIMIQRIEDRYFNGNDISGFSGCKDTEDGIYPPGSRSGGWGTYLKEGHQFHCTLSMNDDMREEITRRERGEESEYPDIEDPNKYICEDEESLNALKEQYHPAWGICRYKDEDHLFIDLHY